MVMTFDFSEALKIMRYERHKVRRSHWNDRRIFVMGDRFYCRFDDDVSRPVEWVPVTNDILALDWRVDLFPGEGIQQKLALGWE